MPISIQDKSLRRSHQAVTEAKIKTPKLEDQSQNNRNLEPCTLYFSTRVAIYIAPSP